MTAQTTIRDDTYYFDVAIFQVEDTLFRVPKQKLVVAGTPFETMFSLPSGSDSEAEGQTDDKPIKLPVSKPAFRAFLSILYPFNDETHVMSYEDWVGVLELSSMWEFDEIRHKAIGALTPMLRDGNRYVDQILLGRRYSIPDWVKYSYTSLIQLQEIPSIGELTASGLDALTIVKLYFAREQVHKTLIAQYQSARAKDLESARLSLNTKLNATYRSPGRPPAHVHREFQGRVRQDEYIAPPVVWEPSPTYLEAFDQSKDAIFSDLPLF